jgi:hypothetical protein
LVLGAFGDTVAYADGDYYLSWYPAGLRGTSADLVPPPWPLALVAGDRAAVRRAILDGLADAVPAVAELTHAEWDLRGGVIFARGVTDIDDPASGLHERHAIGPQSHNHYHTIDTGKLTTAPLFGKMVADRILGVEADAWQVRSA